MQFNFQGKVALVTGAASGIGLAAAKGFAEAGAAVVMSDINGDAIEAAAAPIAQKGHQVLALRCDVADEGAVKEMIEAAAATFGRLDFAYNNAGIHAPVAYTAEAQSQDFDRVIGVNLKGIWSCMKYELQQMVKQNSGGAIINCSSQSGIVGTAGLGAYTASKHGVIGLTKAAALEYAPQGIRINAVCPGTSDTPMVANAVAGAPEHMERLIKDIPAGRLGTAEEIASAVLWLCSPGAAFMIGQAIVPDGGYTVR